MKPHLLALVTLTGCGAMHVATPVSTTTTTGAVSNDPNSVAPNLGMNEAPPIVVLGDDAASQIASVRCSHEVACGNVGDQASYESIDACVADVRGAHRRELTACPKGVDPYALERCIDDARNETCGAAPSSSCSGPRLCR